MEGVEDGKVNKEKEVLTQARQKEKKNDGSDR